MPKPLVRAGGGKRAISHALRKSRESGGIGRMARRLSSRNACKSCGLGTGGQRGGTVDEAGRSPEICEKAVQAHAADQQAPIREEFFRSYSVAELERWSPMQLEQAGRLSFPITWTDGETHFRRIGWDEALDRLAAELTATPPDQAFFYASGRSSNEAAFLMQALARAYGTNNLHSCEDYCHRASGIALRRMIGSGSATVTLEDFDRTDLVVLAGANPASNHPRLVHRLAELRRFGGTVIAINPLRELGLTRYRVPSSPRSMMLGSSIAEIYLQPQIGTDVALFKALLKAVLERDAVNRVYLRNHVEGWDAVEADAREADWNQLLRRSGVDRDDVERAADAIAAAKRGICIWGVGLTQHEHGVENVTALANLAVARGWIGRPGGGLLPLAGHSNIRGVESMGFAPALPRLFAEKMNSRYGIPIADQAGLDAARSLQAAEQGGMRVGVMLGGNLGGASPDAGWAGAALRNVGTIAHLSTKLNRGQIHGRGRCTLVLPVFVRDEEVQPTTQESMFSFVRMSDGGERPPDGELKSEVEVITALASRIPAAGPFPFERMAAHQAIREEISHTVPGYAAIGEIDGTRHEFHVAGRAFHDPRFGTSNGLLRARVPRLDRLQFDEGQFRMMTVRSDGQFNTVVYDEDDPYRGNRRRDVVMMNAEDGARMRLGEHDPVTVESDAGRLEVVVAFADLPAGNVAMYFPEANALVPRRIDTATGTPAFKSVAVRIVK